MPNPEHIKILLQGMDPWNNWREQQSQTFTPDFTGLDLSSQDLTGRHLQHADFSRSNLSNTKLEFAHLEHATFNNAIADRANFRRAHMEDTSLIGTVLDDAQFLGTELQYARFWAARLNGAYLANSDLSHARFLEVQLHDADFSGANLEGAIFTRCRTDTIHFTKTYGQDKPVQSAKPWQALFTTTGRLPYSILKPAAQTSSSIESIADLIEVTQSLRSSEGHFFYRGQPNHLWSLTPSLFRNKSLVEHESTMLREFIRRRPHDFTETTSALEQIVLARHHELPTRLLDVTENPLVALYFACSHDQHARQNGGLTIFHLPTEMVKTFDSDTISIVASLAKLGRHQQELILHLTDEWYSHATGYNHEFLGPSHPRTMAMTYLYQSIQLEKPGFQERINLGDLYAVFAVRPKESSERIRAQKGAFLLSAFHQNLTASHVGETTRRPAGYQQYHFTIPWQRKNEILLQLSTSDITAETLFPSLDETAKAIVSRYQPPTEDLICKATRAMTKYIQDRLNEGHHPADQPQNQSQTMPHGPKTSYRAETPPNTE